LGDLSHLRLGVTVAFLLLVAVVGADVWRQSREPKAAPGVTAPGFVLRELDGGGSLSLSRLRGHVVVLNFFASWCGPCQDEAAVLRRLSEHYGKDGVVVVGIATHDDLGDAQAFFERSGVSYPAVVATEDVLAAYGVRGLPETVFIDAAGAVSGRPIAGPLTDALAGHRVQQALEETM
jgi:thiol-disulfide isomerase/thioredoxin